MAIKKSGSSKFIIAVGSFVAVAIILGVLYKTDNLSKQDELEIMGVIPEQTVVEPIVEMTETPVAEIPPPTAKPDVEPDIQPAVETETETAVKPTAKPVAPSLPTLDASDQMIRNLLVSEESLPELTLWLELDDLIRRSASYMDGLARGSILSKVFPLSAPNGKFTTHRQDNVIWLNAGNYERYNNSVDVLLSLDMQKMAQIFHKIRPLLESAFMELGYKPRQMDGIILQTIDNILATPVIVEPLKLTRDSVVYKFADPELETLMPLQKQLLRAGPENTRRIQQQAKALKQALLNP
jgi:hypothetical protein